MKPQISVVAFFVLAAFSLAAEPPKEVTKILTFPRLAIREGRRIAGFRIDIYGARVSAFPKIPADWHISLELEGSYRSRVQGECEHGVGGLNGPKELDGIVAAAADDWGSVKIEGFVCVTKDFDTTEEIKIDNSVAKFQDPDKATLPTLASVTPAAGTAGAAGH